MARPWNLKLPRAPDDRLKIEAGTGADVAFAICYLDDHSLHKVPIAANASLTYI